MSWGTEDWDGWLRRDEPESGDRPVVSALREVLSNLPYRAEKTVADIGCGAVTEFPLIATSFRSLVAVCDDARRLEDIRPHAEDLGVCFVRRGLDDLESLRGRFDVVLAVETVSGRTGVHLERALDRVRRTLVEGGILLATFPACPRTSRPYALTLGDNPDARGPLLLHEVELQYRLRTAGFRGMRIRRFRSYDTRPDTLLCMAANRADN